jgi:very-short-patch-repair endonuclease
VPGLALHRRKGFSIGPPLTVVRNESEVVRLEQAVIESWPLLSRVDRRAPAIVAVRDRRTTPDRLMKTLACQPRTSGAREMHELFTAMKDGCRSELELWGHANVFSHRGFPLSEGQLPVPRGKSVVYLDRAFVEELVDVEMDGATYHSAPGQRERDIRRDAWLARLGWLVVRLSHRRLHADRQGVREELLEILRVRRRQLGLQPR